MIRTEVKYSEFHENAPPWRTSVVLIKGGLEIGRVEVRKFSEDILLDAGARFAKRDWSDLSELNTELSAWLAVWVPQCV